MPLYRIGSARRKWVSYSLVICLPRSMRLRLRKLTALGTSTSAMPPGRSTRRISRINGKWEWVKCSSTWQQVTASKESSAKGRSEEHTSELQSQSNLVCRLLLLKKKQTIRHYKLLERSILVISTIYNFCFY